MRRRIICAFLGALAALLGLAAPANPHETPARARELTYATGDDQVINLAGTVPGFRGLVAAAGDGATVYYEIEGQGDYERGFGVITDATPDTLSRDTVHFSSNSGQRVDLATGVHWVKIVTPSLHRAEALASPNTATDSVIVVESSGSLRKTLIDNLPAGGGGGTDKKVAANAAGDGDNWERLPRVSSGWTTRSPGPPPGITLM